MDKICKDELCTGCSTCSSGCPKQCISMVQDDEGFYRPVVDQAQCIECGICRKLCPINNSPVDDRKKPLSFAAYSVDEEIRLSSSSGGIFTILAEEIIDRGGVVFGARYDDAFNVEHIVARDKSELLKMRGSKYVQSKIGEIYRKTRIYLEQGDTVLFTGTPCQIGGLYAYLKKDYDNLYTQDIICHGVPSPLIWRRYLSFIETENHSKATSVEFRNKSTGWKQYSLFINLENGSSYQMRNIEDTYLRSFIMNMTLRQSCENCLFKHIHRQADITLSDFWGIEEIMPDWNDNRGTSIVMIHSPKGKELFDAISDRICRKEVSFDSCIKFNPSMINATGYNYLRKRFIRDCKTMPFERVYQKYCGSSALSKLRRKMALIIRKIKVIL